jgi:lysophospholipase L1-like esterase
MLFTADAVNAFASTATGALPANQWTQVAVTYDGNILTIFTNGVAVGTPATFPTGANGMMSYNKMAVHIGDTNLPYNACAPQGVLMQNVLGASVTNSSQGALSFTIPAGGQVTLVVAAVTDRNTNNYFAAAQQQAQQATTGSLSNLFLAHGAWWSNFWSKSFVQIPNQKIQESWYGSLYLLACCSSSNCPPPSKLGNCITTRTPGWQGDYNLDYNYEASPYTGIANNHQELMDNYMKPLLEEMPRGQSIAQFLYGMTNSLLYYDHWVPAPGWSDDPGTFWGQKSQAIFGAVDCVMRWRYTQDTNYAAMIYPYLKGVANFWDNYLVLVGGYYVDYHDSCWEQSGDDTNPVTTLAFIQLVYPELVKISQILNVDADRRAKWNDIIARLTPLPIVPASSIASLNNLGAPYNAPGVNVIRNSTAGAAFPIPMVTLYQDHAVRSSTAGMSCAQVIFPGWNIGLESDPALLQAASNTVWLAAQWFDYNNGCTFYPGAACVGYDPNAILSNLNTLLTYYRYPSFVIDVGGDSTEQYAIVPATLAAMFVQSYQTNIHVFANWPKNQSAAFANHNACGGFLVSSAITLGTPNYVQIQSTAGQMLNLANPWPGAVVQCISSLTGMNTLSGSALHYQTQVGEVLTLTSTSVTNVPAPSNLTVNTNNSAINLNWNAVPGAAGYNVKRASAIGGPYLNLASGLTGTNYTDTSAVYGTTYYYTVTALAPGFESPNAASVTARLAVNPAALINVDIGAGSVQTGGAVLGGAGDVWNGVTTSTGTIKDATGVTLNGVGYAVANYWVFNDNTGGVAALDAATTPLMRDCVAGNTAASGGTFTVSLTGLSAYINQPFTLVVYAAIGDANQGAKLTLAGATGGNSTNTLSTTGTSRSLTNQVTGGLGVAYQTFTGTLSSGTLTITAANNLSQYYGINGFQFLVAPSLAPFITGGPGSQSAYAGQTIAFNVTAVGNGPLFYQWQATNSAGGGFTNLTDVGPITGSQSNVLTIAGVTPSWARLYQVIVTNASGAVTSAPASLTLLAGQPPLRLMPLGDSITRGGTDPNGGNILPGYRDALFTLNTNANVNFQFVGAAATQSSLQLTAAGQQYHNGFSSYTTGSLLSNLTANVQPPIGDNNVGGYWMTSGTPGGTPVQADVVTLLTGANDIGLNPSNPLQYFTNNEISLLGWFKTNRPNTKVIVATDTPRTDSTANNNWAQAINQWITNNVPALSTNFSTVDLYSLLLDTNGAIKTQSSPDGVCLQDGVHPAHNAYQAMGRAWFNAIQGAANPTAPNFVTATAGLNSQVTLTWTNVPGALSYNVKVSPTNGGPYSVVASNLLTTSYTNNGLTNGTIYYYVVSAVFSGGEGANSYQVNATPGTIPVFNQSFDNNYVSYANYLGAAPAGWTFNGTGNGQLAAVVFPAAGDGRFASYPPPGLNGLNYAQIFVNGSAGAGTLYLNTGYSYVAGATYKLTAGFGIETGGGGGTLAPGAQLQLQNASFTTLAATNITGANTTPNQFKDVSTTYTANGTEGTIVISLAIPAGVAGNVFLDFDNVRLSVVYPPGAAPSTNAYLTALALNPALTFTPAFASNVFSYAATEAYGSTPTVTVTNADLTATNRLIYNGTTNVLASGGSSAPLTLTLGMTNVVTVQVTAPDGVTKQTYAVNILQQPSQTKPVLTNSLSAGVVTLSWAGDHLGYRLLAQTNNLNLGLSSNPNDWATVSGSPTTNAVSVSFFATNLDGFFRLVYP